MIQSFNDIFLKRPEVAQVSKGIVKGHRIKEQEHLKFSNFSFWVENSTKVMGNHINATFNAFNNEICHCYVR